MGEGKSQSQQRGKDQCGQSGAREYRTCVVHGCVLYRRPRVEQRKFLKAAGAHLIFYEGVSKTDADDVSVVAQDCGLMREGWGNPNHLSSAEEIQWLDDVDTVYFPIAGFVEPGPD